MALDARMLELDELRQVEERLLREREECERLEAQIRQLAAGTLPSNYAAASPAKLASPPAPPANRPEAAQIDTQLSQQDLLQLIHELASPNKRAPSPTQSTSHVLSPTKASASMVTNRAVSPTSKAGVVFRSPIYRNASPSRRVGKEKVITSNFSRSPRFKEDKTWVPGPGRYDSSASEFAPLTVNKHEDDSALGHTWSALAATQNGKPTPTEQHELAILAATARIKPQDALSTTGKSQQTEQQLSADASGAAVSAMIAESGGDVRGALEAAVRRERSLRKEIASLHKQLSHARSTSAHAAGRADTPSSDLVRKSMLLDGFTSDLKSIQSDFAKLDDSYTGLQNAINELGLQLASNLDGTGQAPMPTVLAKYPALAVVVEKAKTLDQHIQVLSVTIDSATTRSKPLKNGPSASPAARPTTPSSPLPKSYSSLGKIANLQNEIGTLGDSAEFISAQSYSRKASPERERHEYNGLERVGAVSAGKLASPTRNDAKQTPYRSPTKQDKRVPSPASGNRASLAAAVAAARGRTGPAPSSGLSGVSAKPAAVSPTAPILRRMSVSVAQLNNAAPQLQPLKELTISETLQRIFRYYSLFGDRDSDGQGLKSQQFFKLIRDSGALNPDTRITPADVDMAFTRAAAKSGAASPVVSSLAAKLRFEGFITALNDLAVRCYKTVEATSTPAADPDAFRDFVQEYILAIYPKLKSEALFQLDVAQVGAEEMAASFATAFTNPQVLAFFNEHRVGLQSIFNTYASADRKVLDAHADSPEGGSAPRLSKKNLVLFATDYKIVPDMMSRPDLLSLAREAARAIGRESVDDITYPEWIELLGMIAFVLGDAAVARQRAALLAVSGLHASQTTVDLDSSSQPLVLRLKLLFYNMYENGARFSGEGARMIRLISQDVKSEFDQAARNAVKTAHINTIEQARKVNSVLTENVVV